jgi:leader peptidase (prepilin peptidase)/N-methyltransferase
METVILVSIVAGLFGLVVGSFLNVVIDRMVEGRDIVHGRSMCDHCHRVLSWWELIPIISYVVFSGKSHCCHKPLSIQYPLVERVTAVTWGALAYSVLPTMARDASFLPVLMLLADAIFLASGIVLFFSDVRYQLVAVPMLWISGMSGMIHVLCTYQPWMSASGMWSVALSLCAAVGSYVFLELLRLITHGKAMGDGDPPMAGIVGFMTGYPLAIVAMYAAFLTGAAVGVILMIGKKSTLKSKIAFGPFLIIGGCISVVWGHQMLGYLGFL